MPDDLVDNPFLRAMYPEWYKERDNERPNKEEEVVAQLTSVPVESFKSVGKFREIPKVTAEEYRERVARLKEKQRQERAVTDSRNSVLKDLFLTKASDSGEYSSEFVRTVEEVIETEVETTLAFVSNNIADHRKMHSVPLRPTAGGVVRKKTQSVG